MSKPRRKRKLDKIKFQKARIKLFRRLKKFEQQIHNPNIEDGIVPSSSQYWYPVLSKLNRHELQMLTSFGIGVEGSVTSEAGFEDALHTAYMEKEFGIT